MHTALRKAGELVSKKIGRRFDPLSPPPEDKETYRLIRSARNVGMFQLESPGQINLSRRLKPRRFSDLIAQISLFRPGPVQGDLLTPYVMRKNGLEAYSAPLPVLDEILRPTYSVLIYQEQVLAIARAVAGFSLAEGDTLRRAMTHVGASEKMWKIGREFVRRAVSRGVPKRTAEEIFEWMENFGSYGFSAAHAASFAEISYASAYMRSHHPAEFFCSILNSQPVGFYSPRTVLNEARRTRIRILPPDIHLSDEGFTVEEESGEALRVGLSYCKHLSKRAINSILSERENKPFYSVAELYSRTSVEKDSLAALIKAGFLDALPGYAGKASSLLEEAKRLPKKRRHDRQPEIPLSHPASWWQAREGTAIEYLPLAHSRMERMEWEILGLNVCHHPLRPHRAALAELGVTPTEEIEGLAHGNRVRAAGLLECLQRPPTKSGKRVHFLMIEDERGLLQCTIFEGIYRRFGDVLHHRGAFVLDGRVEHDRRRGFSFLVERVGDLRQELAKGGCPPSSEEGYNHAATRGTSIRAE